MYFTPLLSLGWLFALSLVGDVDVLLLLFGAVVIIVANTGVYMDGRQDGQASTPSRSEDRDTDDIIAAASPARSGLSHR